jgi:hypothetical protein
MRHPVLWALVLLGLPQVAEADSAIGAAVPPVFPDEALAVEGAQAPGTALPLGLDLRIDGALGADEPPFASDEAPAATFGMPLPSDLDRWLDPAQLPSPQRPPVEVQAATGERTEDPAARQPADRGLSFGLEVTPRSPIGALARQNHDQEQDPSVGTQLGRLLERPAFGVRGRYRF